MKIYCYTNDNDCTPYYYASKEKAALQLIKDMIYDVDISYVRKIIDEIETSEVIDIEVEGVGYIIEDEIIE